MKGWAEICEKYRGLWVALKDDEETVVAFGKDAKTALERGGKEGYANPILFRVPDEVVDFVGHENPLQTA